MPPEKGLLAKALADRGIPRREFLKFCSMVVATLALPDHYAFAVADALDKAKRPVLVWL